MKVEKAEYLSLTGENGEELVVRKDSRGEPYRSGISLTLQEISTDKLRTHLFLEDDEARAMRDLLIRLYPLATPLPRNTERFKRLADDT